MSQMLLKLSTFIILMFLPDNPGYLPFFTNCTIGTVAI